MVVLIVDVTLLTFVAVVGGNLSEELLISKLFGAVHESDSLLDHSAEGVWVRLSILRHYMYLISFC